MLNNLIDALQLVLLVFVLLTLDKKHKRNNSEDIIKEEEEEEEVVIVKQEEREILEYIYYCSSSLCLVERFVSSSVNINHYHWCTWEHSDKGTIISIDYQLGGDEWLDLYPGNYLVFNQTHKTFSYLTPAELLAKTDEDVKDYKQWVIT